MYCLPRMRGDRPIVVETVEEEEEFTPHARGSTRPFSVYSLASAVYPACAGIDPVLIAEGEEVCRLPRMRGDRPFTDKQNGADSLFTPHARGSTPVSSAKKEGVNVYPACAGIDPGSANKSNSTQSLPRMRGDRP